MCGISLVVDELERFDLESMIKSMNKVIEHRGPDDDRFVIDKNIAIGHTRLSIIKRNPEQPKCKHGRWISFNGQIYNYKSIRAELELLGYKFDTDSDTEVILSAWDHWGIDSFEKFNGMWAFVIYDKTRNEIIGCRDYFGIKPLVYTSFNGLFAAGSEIKEFINLPGFKSKLNHTVAFHFLNTGKTNYSEETFFDGVKELRAGHYFIYDITSKEIEVEKWFDLEQRVKKIDVSFDKAKEKIRELLQDSIRMRIDSGMKEGACLSGGLDSSSILTLIKDQDMNRSDMNTLTSCFDEVGSNEQEFADAMTGMLGFEAHKVFPNLDDLVDKGEFDKLVYCFEQPFSGGSYFAEYKVYDLANKNHNKVVIDGQGSDEYFMGYGSFFVVRVLELLRSFRLLKALKLVRSYAQINNINFIHALTKIFSAKNFRTYIRAKLRYTRRIFNESWVKKKVNQGSLKVKISVCRPLCLEYMKSISLPYNLHYSDKSSMSHSVEVRTPFLDPNLVLYVMSLPTSYKIKDGYLKYILREAIHDLPEEIRYRKDKMGFPAPTETWMKRNAEFVRSELRLAIDEGIFFKEELLSAFDKFIKGKSKYDEIFFRAITMRRFIKIFKMEYLSIFLLRLLEVDSYYLWVFELNCQW